MSNFSAISWQEQVD